MHYVVVEHLEPCISPWMLSEYAYLSKLFKNRVIFTNVRSGDDAEILKHYGEVIGEDFIKALSKLGAVNTIILDLKASKTLSRDELIQADAVVIGGIMGDHPPRGRTEKLITSKAKHLKTRNLGKKQLTIAGVAYIIKEMEGGKEFEDIEIGEGIQTTIQIKDVEVVIELPYAFPLKDGKPVLPENYLDIVARKVYLYDGNPCINVMG